MDLKGKLDIFDATTIFQMLYLAQLTGKLQLKAASNSARIFFDHGNIVFAEITNKTLKLGEYLVDKGWIDDDQLKNALKNKPKNKRIGDFLVDNGAIRADALRSAVESQIKEVIYEVVRWREGTFSYRNGQKPKSEDIFLDVPTDHLMLEGLKRMDEAGDHPE